MLKSVYITLLFTVSFMTTTAQQHDLSLVYMVREPKIKTEHPPILLLLHGVGSNESDLFGFANQLPDQYLIVSARGPITLGQGSYAWYQVDFSTGKPVFNFGQEEISRKAIIHFIEEIKVKYHLVHSSVLLCGFSQGGIMSYGLGLTRSDLIQGIAVMSGRLLEEIKPLMVSNTHLKSLRIFISHGTKDQTLNVHYAHDAVTFLKTKGMNPIFRSYAAGHEINQAMFSDLLIWLNENH